MRFETSLSTGRRAKRVPIHGFCFRPERALQCTAGRECLIRLDRAAAAQLRAFDGMVLEEAAKRSREWFGRDLPREALAKMYAPLVNREWVVRTRRGTAVFGEDGAGHVTALAEHPTGMALVDVRVEGLWIRDDRFGVDVSTHSLFFAPK